ncbi:MAG: nucleotide sugar dehydrogenase [Bacteroidales bacterium]|jgi:UDP-N-acetyl-D-galactosamine dehydrogenase|nr:nucleotide sugar dehydrogenase [Bacteroidales bacterium]
MFEEILNNKKSISVIGLGYVGLPIALEFSKKVHVIGFDINKEKINLIKNHIDPSKELTASDFENTNIEFTHNFEDLKKADFHIIAVPTPIDKHNLPDLKPLFSATEFVGKILKKGDYIVYESTVYPGCTEEECVPILEKNSGLNYIKDFKVGFSPERINPGDKKHSLATITKITSGCDSEAAENIAKIYEIIVKAGVYRANSIKVAEAAKIIENTQRDVNIALMNEFSMIFNMMNINTYDVLEAANTKWNFLNFKPGLVGGHCIGVDPYYLSYKAKQIGYHAKMIESGRSLNDSMGAYVAQNTLKLLINNDKDILKSKILVLGITFKENVADIRNSKVIDIINELKSYKINFDVFDMCASSEEVKKEYDIQLINDYSDKKYDAVIIAVNHDNFLNFDENYFQKLLNNDGIIIDIKGIYQHKINNLTYWSL